MSLIYLHPQQTEKARYTPQNTRKNFDKINDPTIKLQARSIACIVESNELKKEKNSDNYRFKKCYTYRDLAPEAHKLQSKTSNKIKLDEDEPFADEIAPGNSTAWILDKDTLVTNWHCIFDENKIGENGKPGKLRKNLLFVFDFIKDGKIRTKFKSDCIYRLSSVIDAMHSEYYKDPANAEDWALVKVDREMTGRIPLEFDLSPVSLSEDIYLLGHPWGLPLKYTPDGHVTQVSRKIFCAAIGCFAGNSGSPIFNATTNKVRGMLFMGPRDDFTVKFIDVNGRQKKRLTEKVYKPGENDVVCQKITFLIQFKDAGTSPPTHYLGTFPPTLYSDIPRFLRSRELDELQKILAMRPILDYFYMFTRAFFFYRDPGGQLVMLYQNNQDAIINAIKTRCLDSYKWLTQ